PREQLIELLWPESHRESGQRNLRTELSSLRRQLEPPGVPHGAILIASRATLQLNPAACITDVSLFEAALKAAEQAPDAPEGAVHLIKAAEASGGELLPGYFEDWIRPERRRLAEAYLAALHTLVALLAERGDRTQALQWARRAAAADPLHERSHEDLIRLLMAAGEIEAARAQFEQAQQLLERELGASLSPEIHALIRELAPSKDRLPHLLAGQQRKRRRSRASTPGPDRAASGFEPHPTPDGADGISLIPVPPSEPARASGNL